MYKAVLSISCTLEPAIAQKSPFPLLNGIASIHLAYSVMEKEVFYFSELCARNPDLPAEILDSQIFSSEKVVKLQFMHEDGFYSYVMLSVADHFIFFLGISYYGNEKSH